MPSQEQSRAQHEGRDSVVRANHVSKSSWTIASRLIVIPFSVYRSYPEQGIALIEITFPTYPLDVAEFIGSAFGLGNDVIPCQTDILLAAGRTVAQLATPCSAVDLHGCTAPGPCFETISLGWIHGTRQPVARILLR